MPNLIPSNSDFILYTSQLFVVFNKLQTEAAIRSFVQ